MKITNSNEILAHLNLNGVQKKYFKLFAFTLTYIWTTPPPLFHYLNYKTNIYENIICRAMT